jgi:hypothetical protein
MTRRGRKRKPGVREPNGRLSRKQVNVMARLRAAHDREEHETLSVGLDARERVHGVDPQHTRDQKAGSVVGRLCLSGAITAHQYDAAMTWLEERADYLRAVSPAQGSEPRALDPNAAHGASHYENAAAAQRAVARYRAACRAVQDKQNEVRLNAHLNGALDAILVRDVLIHNLVGDLRIALNALAKHYGLTRRAEAA